VRLFALEGAMLGLMGSLLGVGLTFICWLVVKMLNISWIPPTITVRLPLEVYIVVLYLISSAVFLVILSIGAAIFPARRAAYRGIVEALGHA
jgi:putative ABC transport system permease protein